MEVCVLWAGWLAGWRYGCFGRLIGYGFHGTGQVYDSVLAWISAK